MPPAIRDPAIFMLPSHPHVSWASMMIAALIILDVGTEIGEYHDAVQQSPKWGRDARTTRRARRAVNVAAMQAATIGMASIVLSAFAVMRLTRGMDGRMTLVLEGVSRLEAAHLLAYISVKTPQWIGVYHSPDRERRVQHVGGEGGTTIDALKFHVRYSIGQYFVLVFCLCLPFTGRPLSALLGFSLGFSIELLLLFARGGDGERRFRVSFAVASTFAFASSVMFADGCHYIQVVWGSGLYFSEWGLGIAVFFASFAFLLCFHFFHLQRTVRRLAQGGRISIHEKKDKLALSLIRDHVFDVSERLSGSQLAELRKEMSGAIGDEGTRTTTTTAPTTWSLFKMRFFAPTDLVVFSRFEYYMGVIVSVASLFVVAVNIGATKQMNVVRRNFHAVHDALYGNMDQGPVCAFDEIGGTVKTFEGPALARSEGYRIAHCGACGECSIWRDLRLQYTTREYLAKESARCAKKSLVFGRDAVHDCLGEEPIGFSDRCAECWTEDILCARSHCAFIFLQSNMINTVSNFQVGDDTITAATCEEAMCELAFVPCSGANRRRMNITSTIARPGRQLCSIVDVDWADIFGQNGSYKFSDAHADRNTDEL